MTRGFILGAIACALTGGCLRAIEIERFATPRAAGATNDVTAAAIDGGWRLEYLAVGLKTDVSSIKARKSPGGGVSVEIDGVMTDVSSRNAEIVDAAGKAAGKVAAEIVR